MELLDSKEILGSLRIYVDIYTQTCAMSRNKSYVQDTEHLSLRAGYVNTGVQVLKVISDGNIGILRPR